MNDDLPIAYGTATPIGWVKTELGEIAEIFGGSTPKNSSDISNFEQNGIPWITPSDLTGYEGTYISRGRRDLSQKGFISCGVKKLPKGSVLFSSRAPIGYCVIAQNELCTNQGFKSFVLFKGIIPEFVRYYLIVSKSHIESIASGTTFKEISASRIATVPILLPPLNEQRRIVEKLDRIMERLRRARHELSHIKKLIDRYKQAVLTAAFRGDLTTDWRRKNINLISGSELLEKIKEKQIKHLGSKTKTLFTSGYFDNPIEADFLPDSWTFCQIGNIGTVCNGSTPSRKIPEYWNGCISWVSSGEVRNNIIVETKESITQEGFDNSSVRILPPGTVLLAMIGEGKTRGQTAILKIQATINQNIAAIIIDHGLIASEYLWYWFQSQYQRTREAGNGSGPQALNCQRVRELPFILPPLEEQKEIVRRIEERFAKIDKLEQEYQKAVKLCDRLEQATLAKAFRGELVPQDPNDEPASVLLERIRAERQAQSQGKATKSRRKPKAT